MQMMQRNFLYRWLKSGNERYSGPVTRAAVNTRTHQLAVMAGRPDSAVAQVDYEQAKREITGESDPDRQSKALDGARAEPLTQDERAQS